MTLSIKKFVACAALAIGATTASADPVTFLFGYTSTTDWPPIYGNPGYTQTESGLYEVEAPAPDYTFHQDPTQANGFTTIDVIVQNGQLIEDESVRNLSSDYYLLDLTEDGGYSVWTRITTGAGVFVTTNTIYSPIPEASNLALIFAGLGLIGVAVRRRKI